MDRLLHDARHCLFRLDRQHAKRTHISRFFQLLHIVLPGRSAVYSSPLLRFEKNASGKSPDRHTRLKLVRGTFPGRARWLPE